MVQNEGKLLIERGEDGGTKMALFVLKTQPKEECGENVTSWRQNGLMTRM